MKPFLLALALLALALVIVAVMREFGYAQGAEAGTAESFLWQLLQTGVVVAVVGSVVAVVVRHYFSKYFSRKLEAMEGASKDRLEMLLAHPFFERITTASRQADKMDIGLATPVLREMLRIKFRWWGDEMRKFISDPAMARADARLLAQKNTEVIDAIIAGYEAEWMGMGIPGGVIAGFNKWHTPQAVVALDAAKDAIMSPSRDTNRQRFEGILDAHNYLVMDTLHDCENALRNLGENDRDAMLEYMRKRGYTK